MLLIVFGAGASFDSVHPLHLTPEHAELTRPPLAKDLLTASPEVLQAMTDYPKVNALIHRLRVALKYDKDVEASIEEEISIAEAGNPQRLPELLALRYFLRQVIARITHAWVAAARGLTNYLSLLDQVEVWRRAQNERVVLATFNYDRMLEHAASDQLNWTFRAMEDYVSRSDYALMKLHGSVDWVHEVPLPKTDDQELIRRAEEVWDALAMVNTAGRNFVRHRRERLVTASVPALTVPIHSKMTFECPIPHLDILRSLLPHVDRMVTIGWRGGEQHFLNLAADLLPAGCLCTVVGGVDPASAEEILQNLRTAFPTMDFTDPVLGFSSLVEPGRHQILA